TFPSVSTIGPLYVCTQGSLRLETVLSFIPSGNIWRVILPLADVNDQVKSISGLYRRMAWKSGSARTCSNGRSERNPMAIGRGSGSELFFSSKFRTFFLTLLYAAERYILR